MAMKSLAILAITLLITACFGTTDDATDVEAISAKLNGSGQCDSGDCEVFFKYWPANVGADWGDSTAVLNPVGLNPTITYSVPPWPISGLEPDTDYEFSFCGRESSDPEFACANKRSFRTEALSEIVSFDGTFTAPNIITLTWETQGGTPGVPLHIYGLFHDPSTGARHQNVGYRDDLTNTTGLAFRVNAGLHRYVLELQTSGGTVTKTIEINVPFPTTPVVTKSDDPIYPKQITSLSSSWDALAAGEYMAIRGVGSEITVTGQNSYTFTAQELSANLVPGRNRVTYLACIDMSGLTPAMNQDFCGHPARNDIFLDSAQFEVNGQSKRISSNRIYTTTNSSVTLNWTDTGDSTRLISPLLPNGEISTTATSYTFNSLAAGVHTIYLESCVSSPASCGNTEPVVAPVSGKVLSIMSPLQSLLLGGNIENLQVAEIEIAPGNVQPVFAPVDGVIMSPQPVMQNDIVTSGQLLSTIEQSPLPFVQIVVADDNFEYRDWKVDYSPFVFARHDTPFTSHVNPGATLGVLVSEDNSVWSSGEFADGSITHVTGALGDFRIETLAAPLLNKPDTPVDPDRLVPVKPFSQPALGNASLTKQETLIEVGPYIWFINGGSSGVDDSDPNEDNWNRIVRFDRSATNLSSTFHDDRFCVFHVPRKNAAVMGIDWDDVNGLLWYIESRDSIPGDKSHLAWFDPDELDCENFLDYDNPVSTTQYCPSGSTANDCIHTVELIDSNDSTRAIGGTGFIKVESDAVWVAGYLSSNLARYDRVSGDIDVIRMDPQSQGGSVTEQAIFLGSGPWKIVSAGNYLYLSEFFDGDIVRVDKLAIAAAAPSSPCIDPGVNNDNPCLDEIHTASGLKDIAVHGNKLLFSNSQEFGYVNIDTWTPGVVYTGLKDERNAELQRRGPFRSSDLAVGSTGMLLMNDYVTRSLYRLYPK